MFCNHKTRSEPHAFIFWKRGIEVLPRKRDSDPDFISYPFDKELYVRNVTQKTLGRYTCVAKTSMAGVINMSILKVSCTFACWELCNQPCLSICLSVSKAMHGLYRCLHMHG